MSHLDPVLAIDGIRQFLKLHATCGGTSYDTPALPTSGYRAIAACRCGDTLEYWLTDATLSPRELVEAALAARVEPTRALALVPSAARSKAA